MEREVAEGSVGLRSARLWRTQVIAVTAVLAIAMASSSFALTRVEPAPVGIPGSASALGAAVALSGDTAAVGAAGSIDVYRKTGADWFEEAVLVPTDSAGTAYFGAQLALGSNLIVAATPGVSGGLDAAVYTFARSGSSWQQVDRFEASGPVSLSGSTLALGNGSIFVRAGAGWSQQAQLQADAGELIQSTIVDGDFAVAWSSAFVNNFEIHNYAYFFQRSGVTWARESRIELGLTNAFAGAGSAFALSGHTALVSWNNVVTPYERGSDGTWTAQGELDPLTSAPGFGVAVAIDGERALVSSPSDTVFGWPQAGTAYVFERTNGVWTRDAHVAHGVVNYYTYDFGRSVALDGDTLLIGAPGAFTDAGATGDATVFSKTGDDWTPTAVLTPGNDHRGEQFGDAVALSGSTLLVGADNARTSEPFLIGVAYVFDAVDGQWSQRARLVPSEPLFQGFGSAVTLDQDTAVVGASNAFGATAEMGGAAFVFVRGDGSWPQQARLTDGGSGAGPVAFGAAVAVQGDLIAAGEIGSSTAPQPGNVQLFARSGSSWSPQAMIQPADGTVNDGFGSSIALNGSTLAVGAPTADIGIETDGGAVYVFTNSGGVWSQQAKITASVAAKLAGFGTSVALSGDTLVIGAVDAAQTRGAAYVYAHVGGVWALQDRLVAADSTLVSGSFGASVAISGPADRIVVGQPVGTADDLNGRAFIFQRDVSEWSPASELSGANPSTLQGESDGFGRAVAMSGEMAAIGSPHDGRGGAAYVADVGDVIFANGFETD
ncbi:MAG: hypothetical protein ABIR62_13465 [Dokdonella sp.]|uniref:hypothetical protein n=1 Tax=Dokdonella sp. TaxID=2291710 RepID=UPI0032647E99